MELIDRLDEFLREKYHTEILKAAKEERLIVIDFSLLDRFDPLIADQLLEDPNNVIDALKKAASNIAGEKMEIGIKNLPPSRQIRIRNLRAKHIGKLFCIDTIIKSASEVKPQIYEAIFECPECSAKITVPQTTNIIQKPGLCECGRRGDFPLIDKKMYDIRWLVGVEPFELTTGERPGEISIFLKEGLTTPRMQRKSDPGNRIKLYGIVKELPKRIKGKLSTRMDIYMDAIYFEPSDIEFEELEITSEEERMIKELASSPDIYEKLKASIAPTIYGYDEIKEALVLQLFGGIPHKMPDGTRIRGNIHILLTGDPGVGKTQILKLISSIVPRGKYVSGSGVSGAGLTATVVKNEAIGGWVLEAGALILCNKGLIAIDEFDKMSKDDQIAMHEATSVETVSIAKASIVATLPAQTSILAGANPKLGRFDPYKPIGDQILIPETLLSRFDLKFAIRDKPDITTDEKMADHIITSRTSPERIEPVININLLRKYIAYAKQIQDIELTQEAADILKKFYVEMRNIYGGEETPTISITLRQYEALIRLAEASAKVRLDTKVRVEDAERAIRLMRYSMMQLGYDFETKRFDVDRMDGGVPSSRRRKVPLILDILESLQKEAHEVAVEDLKAEAENQGIKDIDEIIDILKKDGVIFEPRPGYLRKV
ncbi:MAG: minichromosome maintenance protein MCM [Candidatus Aenigmatarchaeota archaeon]